MEWISVEDKLPDEKGQYLVVYHPCYWDSIKPELKVGIDSFRGKNSWAKKEISKSNSLGSDAFSSQYPSNVH